MSIQSYIFATRDGAAWAPGGPLVFAFHGTGGDETQFLDLTTQLMPEARIIAPRGDVSEMGANRFFCRTGEGRYDFDDLWARTEAMAGFIKAHIDAENPSAVIGIGYSNGANIMAAVIDKYPCLFDYAALMHPLVTWEMATGNDLAKLSVLMTAGGRDPICPPDMTGKLADMLEARGTKLASWWHPGGHEIPNDEVAEVARWFGDIRAALQGPQDLEIQRDDDGNKGRWFVRSVSGHEAVMTYSRSGPGSIIIDHTEVPDVFRGQGVAKRLFDQMIVDARTEGLVIVPLCPYAAAQFKKHAEHRDLIDPGFRQ